VSGPPAAGASDTAQTPTGIVPPTGSGRSGFLSDVIVELGFASRDTVEQAVRAARSPGSTVARVLVEMGAITEEQLARATAERYGIDYVDLAGFEVDPTAANLIKPAAARRYRAVPIAYAGKGLLVALADPADALGVNDIAVMTKLEVRPAVAARPALEELLESLPLDTGSWEPEPEAVAAPEPEAAVPEGDELRAQLVRARAEAEVRSKELELLRAELASAEARAETAEREAGNARGLAEELAAADERAEQARRALCEMRDEAERERERAAMTERELREQLAEEERRRSELESRLAEVEGAAFAAERAFEELRLAQGRMRGALRALAEPDAPEPG
jgi:Type II secretion system (T2SS), protein E, N-terminal domain